MSSDPRRIKEARVIKTISYGEVSEFAHFGAKVLHPRTVEPLISAQISLRVRNTFDPLEPGTLIGQQDGDTPRHLSAVTAIGGVLVFIPAKNLDLLDAVQSLLSEFFYVPARAVISVDSHAGRLLCYIVPTTAHHDTRERAVTAVTEMLSEADVLAGWRVEPIDIVAAIGVVSIQQMVQVLNAVKSVKAELLAMGQGSPQCSLLAVRPNHVLRVIRRLHRMVLSVQANLDYAETDPYAPPSLSVPANRRRRQGRQRNNRLNPPDRAIPL
jgi:aspartate kinase